MHDGVLHNVFHLLMAIHLTRVCIAGMYPVLSPCHEEAPMLYPKPLSRIALQKKPPVLQRHADVHHWTE